ncbi:MAG: 50S ribosomal protein L18Ae [Candidatus Saliniplasma sp.]
MKVYKVKGKFRMGRRRTDWQHFAKEVVGDDKDSAVEKIYSLLGSKHRVKRTNIKVREVNEIEKENVEDAYVEDLLKREN